MKLIIAFFLICLTGYAQNFAVILAGDDPSAAGMPTNWPVRVQPIGDAKDLPPEFRAPWRHATKEQLEKWKSDHAAEMEAWVTARDLEATAPKRTREEAIRQAVIDLRTIRDSSGTLTGAQLSNAVRVLARAVLAILEEIRP